jgi:hypothetical protein
MSFSTPVHVQGEKAARTLDGDPHISLRNIRLIKIIKGNINSRCGKYLLKCNIIIKK